MEKKLNQKQIQNLKPKKKQYRVPDGGGLNLLIHPNGSKYWQLRYRSDGKGKLLSYGKFPETSLLEAREQAEEDRKLIRGGVDPRESSIQSDGTEKHFKTVAEEWFDRRSHIWKNSKHAFDVRRSLERDIYPTLGSKNIDEIEPIEVLRCVQNLEERGLTETTYRALERVSSIFRYGIASAKCLTNPARDLKPALKKREIIHHPALDEKEIGEFLREVDSYHIGDKKRERITALAVTLIHLTALRSGELRKATWEEIDFEDKIWKIPGGRMKNGLDHWCPLSRQSIKVLKEIRILTGKGENIFPGKTDPSKFISETTLNGCIWVLGYKGRHTAHGARAVFSTICNDSGQWNKDAVERQLAHVQANRVRSAYNRAEYIEERRKMLQWYADRLDHLQNPKVIPLRKSVA
jgi:integrase